MRLENEHVSDASVGSEVSDHSRKSHLRALAIINAKAQRILDRPLYNLGRNPLGPIAIRQKAMDDLEVETRPAGTDQKFPTPLLHNAIDTRNACSLHRPILNPPPLSS